MSAAEVKGRDQSASGGDYEPLHFKPAARLQYLLSEQLVSDPNVAVLEFVKNGYDADATDVLVSFDLGSTPKRSTLTIADDGSGMDRAEFEQNWMHPGYSAKIDAGPTDRNRIPVGEKGLGRLAAGRLGAKLDVYTRKSEKDPWFHAFFRWADFNDKDTLLEDIPITWDLDSAPPVDNLAVGTVIHISELSLKWNSRPPGRRAKGRAVTRIGRLRQDLEVLLLPLTAAGQEFTVRLQHNSDLPEDKLGLIDDDDDENDGEVHTPVFKLVDYEYKFELKRQGKTGWRIARTVRRSAKIAEDTGQKTRDVTTVNPAEVLEDVDLAGCGPFSGTFYYAPESLKAFKQLRVPTGVRIYRDGVRVDPYGDPEDDWLGAAERKAVRQGHAAIQPNALYGAVTVGRKENPELQPLANREGFIGNAAFDAFLALCREEFAEFGVLIERELLEPRWEKQQAKKRSEEAFNSRQWASVMTRATAHAVRQPVTSAGAELETLRQVIEDTPDMPEQLRLELEGLYTATTEHLQRIDGAVDKMLGFLDVDPEPRDFDLVETVGEAVEKVEPDARSGGVELRDETDDADELVVRAPAGLVEHALEELLENAIQVDRPDGRDGWVRVWIDEEDETFLIRVADNGVGMDDSIKNKLFKQNVSRRGHIGVGLLINRQLMQIARGDITLDSTGPDGTQFSLVIPRD